MLMEDLERPFGEIALTLLAAALVGTAGTWLRQPLVVSFIVVGILLGPAGTGLVAHHDQIALLGSIGIALLLFVVGLKLDVQTIRTLGTVAAATGLGQIVATSVVGFGLALALGMNTLAAAYVAVALTFSSTVIIVKLLSDKCEIDALHGRIAIGLLIVQDVAAILVIIWIAAFGRGQAPWLAWPDAAIGLLGAAGFLVSVAALARHVLPGIAAYLARVPELLVLSGIAWALVLAAASELLGLGKEIGAFVAGTSLAQTPYRDAIASRLVTVRDFLLLFFFIDLGSRLDIPLLSAAVADAIVLSLFVLVGNPLIMMAIMGLMGYRKRTSFLVGLTVAQISEFSLILGALGLRLGHLQAQEMALITIVGLVTFGVSTYLIVHSDRLYEWLAPWLGAFERQTPFREGGAEGREAAAADVIVFGVGRYGGSLVRQLLRRGRRVIGVDFDPHVLRQWEAEDIRLLYGDANDPELIQHIPLEGARWIVSTMPDIGTSRVLVRHVRDHGFRGKIAVAWRAASEVDTPGLDGVDLLLRPYADAAGVAAEAFADT